jgi:hypothetical protein
MKRRYTVCLCLIMMTTLTFISCGLRRPHKRFPYGTTVDRVLPRFVSESCQQIDRVSFRLERGDKSCLSTVTSFGNTECKGPGDKRITAGSSERLLPASTLFLGPIVDPNQCSEVLIVTTGSPCSYTSYHSGGWEFGFCYHDDTEIDVSHCIYHTGVCSSH